MKRKVLPAVFTAFMFTLLSFGNLVAQDNVEKVRERVSPLIENKLSQEQLNEFYESLTFEDGELISYIYTGLKHNLSGEEYNTVTLVLNEAKKVVIVSPAGMTLNVPAGSDDNPGIRAGDTIVFEDKRNKGAGCKPKVGWVCVIRGTIILKGTN